MSESKTDTIERLSRRVGVQDAALWTMRKTLEAHEWAEGGSCPACARYKTVEHKPTCLISGLLGMAVSATENEDPVPTDASSRRVDELERQKDGAYSERDCLVAALSKLLPAHLERHPDEDETWEDDWRWIVFVDGPDGQMSWHIHDLELHMFDHLERKAGNSWDGHSTDKKYARLAAIESTNKPEPTPAFTCPRCGGHRWYDNREQYGERSVVFCKDATCGWSGPYSEHINSGEGE